ncbi:diacylglycerol kinase (ATP) [Bathymodiolus japonicus methanotrophic gill symbiont]|uniref:diacylglycerol kinase n=1 Tax=Bathymodiolus japonicus methanotrophic gill symbiont TaxID=113269 RepID=UPI001B6064BD|nr:diacylglycerol kinase [Bathymodiolus japonicus methanotrophic gill symbiont]GFO72353.1 diacylglycerol kinase (ATP) [Bathymodiolus japonicus methanotrophic gill symbiont]
MAGQQTKGLKRIVNAVFYSYTGFRAVWKHEEAFRQELLLLLITAPLALWLTANKIERLLLIASVVFVLVVELLNSAVETAIDRIGPEHHELSGRAKDIGSAAVMLSLALAALTCSLILI